MSVTGLLTPREQAVLDAVTRAARAGQVCPGNAELAVLIDCNSPSAAVRNLQMLEKKGVVRVKRYQRGRQVTILGSGLATAAPADTTSHWRTRRGKGRADWRDELAELVAEGASFAEAARRMNRSTGYIRQLWREICGGLGWQTA